jgi:hypothetical protein
MLECLSALTDSPHPQKYDRGTYELDRNQTLTSKQNAGQHREHRSQVDEYGGFRRGKTGKGVVHAEESGY